MTENEAKKIISKFCEARMDFARGKDMSDKELEDFCKFSDALNLSISSIEEIQQYRAIGTVEECREAMERQRAKKLIIQKEEPTDKEIEELLDLGFRGEGVVRRCPNCNEYIVIDKLKYCMDCGQALDWSDTD